MSEVSENVDEVTVSDTFASYDARNWDIHRNTSAVISDVGHSSVPSCACVTALASPQKHAHPDAARLLRGVTCVDVCLCSPVHAVA